MTQRSLLALFAAFLLASCASLLGARQVEIPVAQLQAALQNRFPFNNRYLELLDIRVTDPRVSLQPETNRVLTAFDVAVAPPFLGEALSGKLAISGRLRFAPERNALVLAEPRVEQFDVLGLDPLYANRIGRIGSLLAEQMLEEVALYTFSPEQFRYAGTAFVPTAIDARPGGLVVTFEPAN